MCLNIKESASVTVEMIIKLDFIEKNAKEDSTLTPLFSCGATLRRQRREKLGVKGDV